MLIVNEIQDSQFRIEESQDEKNYFIEGIFIQAEVKNGNQRIYPKKVLDEAVSIYDRDYIQMGRGYGELGHPNTPGINLERVCILTQELKADGNNYIGRAKVIDTPYGRIVKELMKEGVRLGVSSRGVGSLRGGKVAPGFRLKAAVDVVADPSAPDAFVNAIMEQREILVESVGEEEFDDFRDRIVEAKKPELEIVKSSVLNDFFKRLTENK